MFYSLDHSYLKRTIKFFVVTLLIFLITFILSIIFSPSIETFKDVTSGTPKTLREATGLYKVWEYILNNGIRVPLQMLILAIIPMPLLYYLNTFITAIIPAIALGFAIHIKIYQGSMIFISAMPHFLLEILGLCIIASSLFKVNQTILRKIYNLFVKKKKPYLSLKLAIVNLLKVYLFIALPILILAAFVEHYLSKVILKLLI